MAGSFFGFDTSLSNLNDDEGGGGEGPEDEYDALNDETFGQADEFDWEMAHEQYSEQIESGRRNRSLDESQQQLEASLSQLVLDETDAPLSSTLNTSSVWRHDPPLFNMSQHVPPVSALKNVCTVEELERQLRHKQQSMPPQQQQQQMNQNYFQPRFPVILQRPPGLQAPVPLPFAPQQNQMHNTNQINQNMTKMFGQNPQIGQIGNPMGPIGNTMPQFPNQQQIGQNVNQFMQNANQYQNQMQMHNQMGQNQMGQNQMGQNQMGQNQMGQNQMGQNQMGQNQMGQNQMGQNQMGQNQMGQNQMGQNQMGQNQMGHNHIGQMQNVMGPNQMPSNGNQFGPNMNQYQHMGQSRMIAPPPGMNMQPRQNFNNVGQFNANFRPQKQEYHQQQPQMNQQNMYNPMLQTQPIPVNQNNHNQLKPSPPNQKAQQTQQKPQKNRVIYNSNQKVPAQNMTSQNLVQMIQNTHPMLQFNNSFHNANHHPMLNRAMYSQMGNQVAFQRNGGYSQMNGQSNRNHMNGDSNSLTDMIPEDEYAGLMSQREKQWLINIQMLQLNTGTPYIDDFYYTVFLERKSRKEKEGVKEAHKANQQNHPFYRGEVKQEQTHRERHNSQRHNSQSDDVTPRTYVPTQFENSLGRLQCGSVTAPRKIIDVSVVGSDTDTNARAPSRASTITAAEVPREMRKTKQLLLDIEALYLIVLRLEELNEPLAISNALILKEREEKQKLLEAAQKEMESQSPEEDGNVFLRNIESVQRRAKTDSPSTDVIDKRQVVNLTPIQNPSLTAKNLLDENKEDLLNRLFAGLLYEDRLQQFLMVRKGKALISRFLSRAPATHDRARSLWLRVMRALSSAARRDDGQLASLAPYFAQYIRGSSGWSAVLESCTLLAEALDPARTPHILTSTLTLTMICTLIEHSDNLIGSSSTGERQWSQFLKTLAAALASPTVQVARPKRPINEEKLRQHLRKLEARAPVTILRRGAKDLPAATVAQALVQYLC